MFDYMGAFLFRSGFAHADNAITKRCSKTITWLFLSRLQGNKPLLNLPKPCNSPPAQTGTLRNLRNLPPEPTPAHIGILWNLPEPASGTYTTTHRNFPEPSGTCLQNLHQHTPEPPASGTYTSTRRNPAATTSALRNLPELASGTYTSTHRNPPEPSGTFLQNLHQHTPEPSGTFRNLPPEPAPATRTGTHRSLSGLKTPLAYAVGEKNMSQILGCYGDLSSSNQEESTRIKESQGVVTIFIDFSTSSIKVLFLTRLSTDLQWKLIAGQALDQIHIVAVPGAQKAVSSYIYCKP